MLEESHRLMETQIEQIEKSDNPDSTKLVALREQRDKYLTELKVMRRAQWENDHETIDYEDDR